MKHVSVSLVKELAQSMVDLLNEALLAQWFHLYCHIVVVVDFARGGSDGGGYAGNAGD